MTTLDPFKARPQQARPKRALALPQSELDRMVRNSQALQEEKAADDSRIEERRKRQEATKALSKRMTTRVKPEDELRKLEYQQAVENAQKVLEREDKVRARRNYVLDLAYKRLYEQTDRVKNFKAAKNMAVMLKDRDQQTEAKESLKDKFATYEKQFLLGMLRDMDSHREEEEKRKERERRDKQRNAEIWRKQQTEKHNAKLLEEWERLRDGFITREDASKYEKEMADSQRHGKRDLLRYKCDLDRQRATKLQLQETFSRLDEADEKRAEIFREAKREMKRQHEKVKEELDRSKNEGRELVASRLRDETSSRRAEEEASLQKALREAEAKYQHDQNIKKMDQEEALRSIKRFYDQEMKAKEDRTRRETMDDLRESRRVRDEAARLGEVEESKIDRRKGLEQDCQHVQLHQIARRNTERKNERLEEARHYLGHMRSLEDEEEVFQRYAGLEIEDCRARGIDTRPMERAARPGVECGKGPAFMDRGPIRPKYYSALVDGDELNHIEREERRPDTKSRLGFILD